MSIKPSPTQAEIDAAALGQHVHHKEPDGSERDYGVVPPESAVPDEPPDVPEPPPVDPEPHKEESPPAEARQYEAAPSPPSSGYKTRALKRESGGDERGDD